MYAVVLPRFSIVIDVKEAAVKPMTAVILNSDVIHLLGLVI